MGSLRKVSWVLSGLLLLVGQAVAAPGADGLLERNYSCKGIARTCTSAVAAHCSTRACTTVTPKPATKTTVVYRPHTKATATSVVVTTTTITTAVTSPTDTSTVTESTTTTTVDTLTQTESATSTDVVVTAVTSTSTPPPLGLKKRTAPTKKPACAVSNDRSACACLGITHTSTRTAPRSTSTCTVTSYTKATGTVTHTSVVTAVTTSTVYSTPLATTTEISTQLDTTVATTTTTTATTTTRTTVVATTTLPPALPPFTIQYTYQDGVTNVNTVARFGHPPFFSNQPSNVVQIGSQSSLVNAARFVRTPGTGALSSPQYASAYVVRYGTPGQSFVAITDEAGAQSFGTDRLLNCAIDPISRAMTCRYDTSPATFYLCGGFLCVTDNRPENIGCAFGPNLRVTLTAVPVV